MARSAGRASLGLRTLGCTARESRELLGAAVEHFQAAETTPTTGDLVKKALARGIPVTGRSRVG